MSKQQPQQKLHILAIAIIVVAALGGALYLLQSSSGGDSSILDVSKNHIKPDFEGKIARSYEDSVEWWSEPKQAPEGAPNVVLTCNFIPVLS